MTVINNKTKRSYTVPFGLCYIKDVARCTRELVCPVRVGSNSSHRVQTSLAFLQSRWLALAVLSHTRSDECLVTMRTLGVHYSSWTRCSARMLPDERASESPPECPPRWQAYRSSVSTYSKETFSKATTYTPSIYFKKAHQIAVMPCT